MVVENDIGILWEPFGTDVFFFFAEVDRAIDNLVKSGKLWNAPRRDSMPMMMGRPYPDYGMLRARMAPRTRF